MRSGYDPKYVKTEIKPVTVDELLFRMQHDTLHLSPYRNIKWSMTVRSRFIESILLGIPVPPVYVSADNNGQWILIDGIQRIRTLNIFLSEASFILSGLEFFSELNGRKSGELTPLLVNKIMNYVMQVVVFSPVTTKISQFLLVRRVCGGDREESILFSLYEGKVTDFLAEASAGKTRSVKGQNNVLTFYQKLFLQEGKIESSGDPAVLLCHTCEYLETIDEKEKMKLLALYKEACSVY